MNVFLLNFYISVNLCDVMDSNIFNFLVRNLFNVSCYRATHIH